MEIQIDPGSLGAATGENGVPAPARVSAFGAGGRAPERAQYVRWRATSQDSMDAALMLRLRQALALAEAQVRDLLRALAAEAEAGAELPCPARTYGQVATPTSWGAQIAQWGWPLAQALERLGSVRAGLCVSLSGAAGTASALGPQAAQTRADLAAGLGLADPGRSWHTDRTPILQIADWYCDVMAALAGLGQGLIGLAAHSEVTLGGAGASSTMPQKQNPIGPSALVALNSQAAGLRASLQSAAAHQHQRDGAAWFTEWMALPQIVLCGAASLTRADAVVQGLAPCAEQMTENLRGLGLIHAEALSFALTAQMPRPEAQATTKVLCREASETQTPLEALARAAHPDLPQTLFRDTQMGHAPAEARAFAAAARALL